jgi:hypothetical protein
MKKISDELDTQLKRAEEEFSIISLGKVYQLFDKVSEIVKVSIYSSALYVLRLVYLVCIQCVFSVFSMCVCIYI